MGSRRQYANKKDANHDKIVSAVEEKGIECFDLSDVKKEGFDVLMCFDSNLFAVEIKNPDYLPKYFFLLDRKEQHKHLRDKVLTDQEKKAYEKLERAGCRLIITYSADHCLREIGYYPKPFQKLRNAG